MTSFSHFCCSVSKKAPISRITMWVIASKTKTNRSRTLVKDCHFVWRLWFEGWRQRARLGSSGAFNFFFFRRIFFVKAYCCYIYCFNSYLVQKGIEDQIVLKPKWSLMRKRKKNSEFLPFLFGFPPSIWLVAHFLRRFAKKVRSSSWQLILPDVSKMRLVPL